MCGICFDKKSKLKSHIRVHKKVDQVKCPLCPKTFANRSSFKRHSQSQHVSKVVKSSVDFGVWSSTETKANEFQCIYRDAKPSFKNIKKGLTRCMVAVWRCFRSSNIPTGKNSTFDPKMLKIEGRETNLIFFFFYSIFGVYTGSIR